MIFHLYIFWAFRKKISSRRARMHKILQTSGSHLKILDARRVTWSKFHIESPQISAATVQHLTAMATWRPGYVHLCRRRSRIRVSVVFLGTFQQTNIIRPSLKLWRVFTCFDRNSFITSGVLVSELLHETESSFRSLQFHSKSRNSPQLWIRKFNHPVFSSLPLLPIQNETNLVRDLSSWFIQNYF